MKHSFQIMVSGTIETSEDGRTGEDAVQLAARQISTLSTNFLKTGLTGLTFDTVTSGIKLVPDSPYAAMMGAPIPVPGKPAPDTQA